MRISRMPALAVAVLLTSAPSCSRTATVAAVVNPNGTVCFPAGDHLWKSDQPVPNIDPERTRGLGGTFEATGDLSGSFTPAGTGTVIAVHTEAMPLSEQQRASGTGSSCAIR